jgi:3-hydroxyisobutyrate dehydrogenase
VETEVRNELTRVTLERFREVGACYGEGAWEMTLCKVIEDAAGVPFASRTTGSSLGR